MRCKHRTHSAQYNAALKARGSLPMWLAAPSGKRGRSQTFSASTTPFFLSIKGLWDPPLHQALGMEPNLFKLTGWLSWITAGSKPAGSGSKPAGSPKVGANPTTTAH